MKKYFFFAAIFIVGYFSPLGIIVNTTPSMPRGIYIKTPWIPPAPGRVALVCEPQAARAWRMRVGMRFGGHTGCVLVKRLIGQGCGTTTKTGITLNGKVVPHSAPLPLKSVQLPHGAGCSGKNRWWVQGRPHERSWDSRYFGPSRIVTTLAYTGIRLF